jgi:hypothetical protein
VGHFNNYTRDWNLQSATAQVCTAWPGSFVFKAQKTTSANVSLKNQFSEESPHARHGLVHARRTSKIIWTQILQFYGTFINQQITVKPGYSTIVIVAMSK